MKSEKAWPTKLIEAKLNSDSPKLNSDSPKLNSDAPKLVVDAKVYPKAFTKELLDKTVNQTLDKLLSESFHDDDDDAKPEKKHDIKPKKLVKKTGMKDLNVLDTQDTKPLWIAFSVFVLVTLFLFVNIFQKISNIESWLHGRLLSSP